MASPKDKKPRTTPPPKGKKPRRTETARLQGDASDELGQHAQSRIAGWAADVGAVSNESHRDRRGWDFLVSFRAPKAHSTDLFDIGATESSCWLQVKATRGRHRRAPVKRENWRRAMWNPSPFFFVVLEYGRGRDPERAYVVHVDAALTEQVAKQLWAKPRAKLDLKWNDDHACECSADGVFDRIRSLIGTDFHAYVHQKLETWRAFESQAPKTEVTIRMPGERAAADIAMAEWAVGMTDELFIASFTAVEKRYGVERVLTRKSPESKVSIERLPSVGSARLSISNAKEAVELDATVYSSNTLFPFLPEEATRVRLATKFLSVVLGRGIPPTVRLNIDAHEAECSVQVLAAHAKALRVLASGAALSVTMESSANEPPMVLTVSPLVGQDLAMVDEIRVFELLQLLYERAGVPEGSVRPGAVLGRRGEIMGALELLDPGSKPLDMTLPDSQGKVDITDDAAVVLIAPVTAGQHHFLIGAYVRGPLVRWGASDLHLSATPQVARVVALERGVERKTYDSAANTLRLSIVDELRADGLKLHINPWKDASDDDT